MSVVHNNLQQVSKQKSGWFLKIADGSIFGPVDTATLCEWAAQSRIVPGNEVSSDRKEWTPAESMPELKMEWDAELPDGRKYGPFNVLAVPNLCTAGTVTPDARLTNRHTGKMLNVRDIFKPAHHPDIPHPATDPNHDKWKSLYDEERKLREKELGVAQKVISDLSGKIREFETGLANAQRSVESQQHELQIAVMEAKSKEQRLKESLQKAKEEAESLKSKLERAEAESGKRGTSENDLRSMLEVARLKLAEKDRDIDAARKEAASHKTLQVQLEKSVSDREAALAKDLAAAKAAAVRIEQELEKTRNSMVAMEKSSAEKEKALAEEVEKLKTDIRKTKAEAEKHSTSGGDLRAALESACSKLSDKETELDALKKQKDSGDKQLNNSIAALKQELLKLRSSMTAVENLAADREKALSEQAEKLRDGLKKAESEAAEHSANSSELRTMLESARQKLAEKDKDIDAVRKEAASHKTLQVQLEKSAADREEALTKDLGVAKAAVTRLEQELAKTKKTNDISSKEMQKRNEEIQKQMDSLQKESHDVFQNLDKARKEILSQRELSARSEARATALESQLATLRNQTSEGTEMLMSTQRDLKDTAEALEKRSAELEAERNRSTELRNTIEKENERHSLIASELEAALASSRQKSDEANKELSSKTSLIEQMSRAQDTFEINARDAAEQMMKKIDLLSSELAEARKKITEELRVRESLQKHSSDREISLTHQLDEERKKADSQKANYEASISRLQDMLETTQRKLSASEQEAREKNVIVAQTMERLKGEDSLRDELQAEREKQDALKKTISRLESESAGLRKNIDAARQETLVQKELLDRKSAAMQDQESRFAEAKEVLEKQAIGLEQKIKTGENEAETLRRELAGVRTLLAAADKSKNRDEGSLKVDLQSAREAFAKSEQKAAERLKQLNAMKEQNDSREKASEEDRRNLEKALHEANERCSGLERQAQNSHSRLEKAEELTGSLQFELKSANDIASELKADNDKTTRALHEANRRADELEKANAALSDRLSTAAADAKAARIEVRQSVVPQDGGDGASRNADMIQKELAAATAERKNAQASIHELQRKLNDISAIREIEKKALSSQIAELQKKLEGSGLKASVIMNTGNRPSLLSALATAKGVFVLMFVILISALPAYWYGSSRTDGHQVQPAETPQAAQTSTPEPPQPSAASIKTEKTRTSNEGKTFSITFDFGIFSSYTNMAPDAAAILSLIADKVRPHTSSHVLFIEGHTDQLPVSTKSAMNNYELGMARAVTVSAFLNTQGLPQEFLRPISAGEKNPPHPGNDIETQKKNRTVILKLVPKEALGK